MRQRFTLSSFVEGMPAPDIQDKVALMPYCDNGNIISTDPKQAIMVRDKIIKKLRETGFGVHEITDAETKFDTLGVSVDGVHRVVCSTPQRVSKMLAVLEFLFSGARVSGQQLEHVLGHITCCCISHPRFFVPLWSSVQVHEA